MYKFNPKPYLNATLVLKATHTLDSKLTKMLPHNKISYDYMHKWHLRKRTVEYTAHCTKKTRIQPPHKLSMTNDCFY